MKNKTTITDVDIGRYSLRFKEPYEIKYDFNIKDDIEIIIRDGIFGYVESNISLEDALLKFKYCVVKMWRKYVEEDNGIHTRNILIQLLEPIQILKEEYSPIEFIELLGLDNDSKQMTIDVLNQLNDSFKQFGYHIVLKIGVDN